MIFYNTKFTGHYPVGSAALVTGVDTRDDAATKLNIKLVGMGLPGDAKAEDMQVVNPAVDQVIILVDGNY